MSDFGVVYIGEIHALWRGLKRFFRVSHITSSDFFVLSPPTRPSDHLGRVSQPSIMPVPAVLHPCVFTPASEAQLSTRGIVMP